MAGSGARGEARGVGVGDPGHPHLARMVGRRGVQGEEHAGGVGVELGRVDRVVEPGNHRALADLEHVEDLAVVEAIAGVVAADELVEIAVVVEGPVEVGMQLVAADVVQRLEAGPVRIHHPGEEVVEAVPFLMRLQQVDAAGAGLRELLVPGGERDGVGTFARPVERAVGRRIAGDDIVVVAVGLLVALQVVPAGEDDPAEAVHRRLEVARKARDRGASGRRSPGRGSRVP